MTRPHSSTLNSFVTKLCCGQPVCSGYFNFRGSFPKKKAGLAQPWHNPALLCHGQWKPRSDCAVQSGPWLRTYIIIVCRIYGRTEKAVIILCDAQASQSSFHSELAAAIRCRPARASSVVQKTSNQTGNNHFVCSLSGSQLMLQICLPGPTGRIRYQNFSGIAWV